MKKRCVGVLNVAQHCPKNSNIVFSDACTPSSASTPDQKANQSLPPSLDSRHSAAFFLKLAMISFLFLTFCLRTQMVCVSSFSCLLKLSLHTSTSSDLLVRSALYLASFSLNLFSSSWVIHYYFSKNPNNVVCRPKHRFFSSKCHPEVSTSFSG